MGKMFDKTMRRVIFIVIIFQFLFMLLYLNATVGLLDKDEIRRKIHDWAADEEEHKHMHQKRSVDIGGPNVNNKPLDFVIKPVNFEVKKPTVKMAMDSVRSKYSEILKKQKYLLKTQDRFTDQYYGINITISDTVSMDRTVNNFVPEACLNHQYNRSALPTASVIVPFYNEALSVLMRTVHSILNRSPDELLTEIILVDDLSTKDYLKESFDEYVKMLPKVRIIRNEQREGLIMSRMIGSRAATGDVVVFLDAHSECNEGWLEPMLDEIRKFPNTVVQPFVDGIDKDTLAYYSTSGYVNFHQGVFGWDLKYVWMKLPDHTSQAAYDAGAPFPSPTLVGCALAADRKYFEKIGEFDGGLKVWGGENLELGFRAWQCGGRVVTVICSRVGHVFKNFPHKFNNDRDQVVAYNLMRVAETWMDGYRKYFYASSRTWESRRRDFTPKDFNELQPRVDIRKRLNCKSFDWYMHNIMPQVEAPPVDAIYYGEIQNLKTSACWEVLDDYTIGMNYVCYEHKIIPRNFFALMKNGLLKYKDKCVKHNPPHPILTIAECPSAENEKEFGLWSLETFGPTIGVLAVQKTFKNGNWEKFCLAQVTNVYQGTPQNHSMTQMPNLSKCGTRREFESWSFTWKFSWDQVPDYALSQTLVYS